MFYCWSDFGSSSHAFATTFDQVRCVSAGAFLRCYKVSISPLLLFALNEPMSGSYAKKNLIVFIIQQRASYQVPCALWLVLDRSWGPLSRSFLLRAYADQADILFDQRQV